jgi:hypothetical protein
MNANTQTANLLNSVADFLDSLVIEKISTPANTHYSIRGSFPSAAHDIRILASILSSGDAVARFSKGFEMVKDTEDSINGVISNAIALAQNNEYISKEAERAFYDWFAGVQEKYPEIDSVHYMRAFSVGFLSSFQKIHTQENDSETPCYDQLPE